MGNIRYYVERDDGEARAMYEQAERNGYREPELHYRMGFINYVEGRLERGARAPSRGSPTRSLRTRTSCLANTLYRKSSDAAARGYYRDLARPARGEKGPVAVSGAR